ncbi:hypothetical protein [Pseudomonas fluorescens]|uniref:Uncharacterized protein n=1 Tax=Pseudomonas fluorescens TaxID=294 RepID=A0A944HGV8_PSEFL|nr:hypothetical protein [Pseudomonas fluorescens]MBT2294591.1 hypothetical protein [Pseudomonas fluorescens]MBT2306753.1 hypothetical protein [Pseudomonas fluorescens]MBT2316337.1 hypothetical protein [Pseudomonas fluorescens]MBT2330129.1 hypothetical protein [Pseudomonas fluorescens]MBT2342842.1 hypothetical protein [Pseudomonas fluorescens]
MNAFDAARLNALKGVPLVWKGGERWRAFVTGSGMSMKPCASPWARRCATKLGLNLTTADTVIHFEPWWNLFAPLPKA